MFLTALLLTEYNPAFGQIVRRHFQSNRIPWKYSDKVQPHFAADMGHDNVSAGYLHLEHGVRQQLFDYAVNPDYIVFGHVKISGVSSVINTKCSK